MTSSLAILVVELQVPGDKSVAHRLLVLASLADGDSNLAGVPESLDVRRTLECLQALGARIEDRGGGHVSVRGPTDWRTPSRPLDCGNSGTTARLLIGLLAGLGVGAELRGDPSLSDRPMDRVVYPLQAMGARITYVGHADRFPVRVEERASGELRTLRYRPRVSSAQVRAALLLAALTSRTDLEILDRLRPRDHTERMLRAMGAPVQTDVLEEGERVSFRGSRWSGALQPLDVTVPGDLSSAAFLMVSALLSDRPLKILGVGLNQTRAGFLEVLSGMGASIAHETTIIFAGEPVGSLLVEPGRLGPFEIGAEIIPRLVDEVPALVALASRVDGLSVVRGAAELRVKESDRISLMVSNLQVLGVACEETDDGLRVRGSAGPLIGTVRTSGDHRIAMAFGALGCAPGCDILVDDPECVDVSFPGFWRALDDVTRREAST
ncbi:MAG: 3-phosphoshikimate 1-carboxyvinyltransferase [Gemmatimonadetes bacterium]|nr:3-phosphoshikimate 1-carboxyvinyltransferase [Gemmatimonadota bacterium]